MDCLSIALAVSLHLGLAGDYNSLHPHVRCDVNNTVAGVYLNSEENLSGYAAYQFQIPYDIELEVGWVTGYNMDNKYNISPMFRIVKDNWFITPAYETKPNEKWGIAVGFELPLTKKN